MSFNTGVESLPEPSTPQGLGSMCIANLAFGPESTSNVHLLPAQDSPYIIMATGLTGVQKLAVNMVLVYQVQSFNNGVQGSNCCITETTTVISKQMGPFAPCGTPVTLTVEQTFIALPAGVAYELVLDAGALGTAVVTAGLYRGEAPLPEVYYPCCPCTDTAAPTTDPCAIGQAVTGTGVNWNQLVSRDSSGCLQSGEPTNGDLSLTGIPFISFTPTGLAFIPSTFCYEVDQCLSANAIGVLALPGTAVTLVGKNSSGSIVETPLASAGLRNIVTNINSVDGVLTLDYALGDHFRCDLSEDITSIVFTNLPATGRVADLSVLFVQNFTIRTVSWPASFIWEGGVASGVSLPPGSQDVLTLTNYNGFFTGSNWFATFRKAWAA